MAMTYAELVTAIQDYCENTETSFVAQIPTFVTQAETRIYNSVQLPAMRKSLLGNMTASNQFLTGPADFLAMFELSFTDAGGAEHYLINKDLNYIREVFPVVTATGAPTHYALLTVAATPPYTTTILLGPTPNANYVTTFNYYAYPVSIVTAGTSWLGNNFDAALTYGAIREAYVYLKGEPEILAQYDKMYMEALALLKGLADGKDRKDTYRGGQFRLPVG